MILPLGDLVTGGHFTSALRTARTNLNLSETEIPLLRERKLARILTHALNNSPYYSSLGIVPDDDPVRNLSSLPILEKTIVREKCDQLITTDKDRLVKISSSGSSGYQTTVYQSKMDRSVVRAVQTAFWEKAGFRMGYPVVQTGINPNRSFEKRMKDLFFNTLYVPAFAMSVEDVRRTLDRVKRHKEGTVVLIGYSSSLYVLATHAEEMDIRVRFRSVISLGDKMFDHYRHKISAQFHAPVLETYGASEGLMMGFQTDLNYMYIPDFHVIVEIVNDDGMAVSDGELGHVIVTSLDNYAMPLLRYRVGDLAIRLPRSEYPERRDMAFSLLQKVIGRDTDIVRTPAGKSIVVHSFTGIFEHWPQIRQFCVIQEKLNGITIEYIPSEDFEAGDLEKIEQTISHHVNEPFEVTFKEVKEIEPTASGKPQLIISRL